MSDHYGPWHSHDSAPQMELYIGLADVQKKDANCLSPDPQVVLGVHIEVAFVPWRRDRYQSGIDVYIIAGMWNPSI